MINQDCKILEYPSRFDSEYILAMYPEVEDEMMRIYEKTGRKDKLAAQLSVRIRYLEEKKKECILHREWFENYTGMEWLYCLKIKDRFHNFRIYFIFDDDKAVFLHAFVEKNKSDINKAKSVAEQRYLLFKE